MGAHNRQNAAARSRAPLHTSSDPAEQRRSLPPAQAASVAVLVALALLVLIVGATLLGVLAETVGALTAFVGACAAFTVLRTAAINHRIALIQLEKTTRELEGPSKTHEALAAPAPDVASRPRARIEDLQSPEQPDQRRAAGA